MTSALAAVEAVSPTGAPPLDPARRYLLDLLTEQIALHDETLARRGVQFTPHISQFRWNKAARRFSCVLPREPHGGHGQGGANGAQEVLVEVALPFAVGEPLRATCGCPSAEAGLPRCAHTWAALTEFMAYLDHYGDDPLAHEVFALDERPSWNRTLDTLDGFLAPTEPGLGAVSDEAQRRLVWRVRLTADALELSAWEQRVSAQNGEWTAGRRVGWERLRGASELWTCAADRKAVAAIREHTEPYRDTFTWWQIDPFAALLALVGHPLVFDHAAPERRLQVERAEVGVEVELDGGGLLLDAALAEVPLRRFAAERLYRDPEERGLLGRLAGADGAPDRLLVAPTDARVLGFVRSLEGQPRFVPAEGQEELLQRLHRLEAWLPVRLPDGLVGATVLADPSFYLRLTPIYPAGLLAQIRVRPAPEGFYCLPGEGPERLTGIDDGRRVAVIRRPEEERLAAQGLVGELGLDERIEERPWQWRILDGDEALDLILAAQEHAAAGLRVEWPAGGARRVAARLGTAQLRIEVADRNDWFSLEGGVEVDGWRLPLVDLLLALRSGRRYVALGSDEETWAEITDGFRERLEELGDVVHLHRRRLEVDVTGAPALRELIDGEAELVTSERFELLSRRFSEAMALAPEPPADFRATLRAYQLEGFRWMCRLAHWGVGGCLADDMGLGKTVQTLCLLSWRRDAGPALVVAPTSLGFNWRREAERFAPALHVVLYRDTDRETVFEGLGAGDLVVVSYGLLVRDLEKLAAVPWGTLVLDEAQAIKNSRTKTAQAVRRVEAEWALALSGTPIENHLGELWSLFRSLSPGLFGTWKRFRDRFAGPIEKEKDTVRREALSKLVRPFILRRTKTDVLHELPARTEAELWVELSPEERQLYEDVRLKALMQLAQLASDGPGQRFQVLAALTRLRQLSCHPRLADATWKKGSAKLSLLLEVAEELRGGAHRALIFSQFTRHLAILREALEERGFNCQYLDGQTPVRERQRRVDAFQGGAGDVFLISLMAGGVGLNLTAADYVIHMDPWWNPAVEDQATDRAHRMGQKRPVTVYRLVTRGTIEEEILRLHADKRHLMAGVLAGTDKAGQMTTDELVDLLRSGGDEEAEG